MSHHDHHHDHHDSHGGCPHHADSAVVCDSEAAADSTADAKAALAIITIVVIAAVFWLVGQ